MSADSLYKKSMSTPNKRTLDTKAVEELIEGVMYTPENSGDKFQWGNIIGIKKVKLGENKKPT